VASGITRGFVKICGVTNVQDAQVVVRSGANALGLIVADSPRRVSVDEAREIARATKGDLLRCVVVRHQDEHEVLEVLDVVDVDMVQVHGPLGAGLIDALRERGLLVVKALSIEDSEFDDFDETLVDAVLIDGAHPGSGNTHSWTRLLSRSFRVPFIAAGGLNPLNVGDVVEATGAWGVDSASGVEAGPREKNHDLVDQFVANARRAFAGGTS
jgi:phosphoribosylanthranilate isomerase